MKLTCFESIARKSCIKNKDDALARKKATTAKYVPPPSFDSLVFYAFGVVKAFLNNELLRNNFRYGQRKALHVKI